jgi:hypothetical protein
MNRGWGHPRYNSYALEKLAALKELKLFLVGY